VPPKIFERNVFEESTFPPAVARREALESEDAKPYSEEEKKKLNWRFTPILEIRAKAA
jgi:hypothetical protein